MSFPLPAGHGTPSTGTEHQTSLLAPGTPDRRPYSSMSKALFKTPPRPKAPPGTPASSSRSLSRRETLPKVLDQPKTVYLIRHGQSLGQAAPSDTRRTDRSLQDCRLSPLGVEQARRIPKLLGDPAYQAIQLVLCSPLARAMETAILAFPDKPIRIHHDLREIGDTTVPENIPLADAFQSLCHDMEHADIRFVSALPSGWPRRHDVSPRVLRRRQVQNLLQESLATDTTVCPEHITVVAVVCHYHVIRAALADAGGNRQQRRRDGPTVSPENAKPIRCVLTVHGELLLAGEEKKEGGGGGE